MGAEEKPAEQAESVVVAVKVRPLVPNEVEQGARSTLLSIPGQPQVREARGGTSCRKTSLISTWRLNVAWIGSRRSALVSTSLHMTTYTERMAPTTGSCTQDALLP